MYYESIPHHSVLVPSAEDAARRIRSGAVPSFHALIWENPIGQRIAAVDDGQLDSPWSEVAVINLDTQRQIESITFAWCTEEESVRYLQESQAIDGMNTPAHLPLDGAGETTPARFTCSSCGDGFTSTIAAQAPHDQDHGYGYCLACLR